MSRRSLIIALIVSVALNLFALGAVVGGFAIAHRLHGMGPVLARAAGQGGAGQGGGGQGPLWTAADSLAPAQREAYRRILHAQARDLMDQVRAARQARRAAWMGLKSDTMDAQAVTASLAKARDLEMQARLGVENAIVEFAAGLPLEERAKLADGLAKSGGNVRLEMRVRRPGPQ